MAVQSELGSQYKLRIQSVRGLSHITVTNLKPAIRDKQFASDSCECIIDRAGFIYLLVVHCVLMAA